MRHTPASLAARLAKLEQRHTPTLALAGEVRVFGPDGERINGGVSPPAPGGLRAVVNVHLGQRVAPEVERVVLPPEPPAPLPAPVMLPVEPAPAPILPATSAMPRPVIAPMGPLVIGGPGDALVDFGDALARARARARGEWLG